MPREISLAELPGLVGQDVGVSQWITIDQAMIDAFAHATHDHQFIHTDPERAKAESPYGGTIAHGFLTVSLLSTMNYDCVPVVREQTMGINYGFEALRLISPVRSGARIRGRFTLTNVRFRGAAMCMTTYDVTVEIENEQKPALTATWQTIIQFDPKDRPEDV
ncbi:MaoC family dehydratase [Rhizobium oryziradicis]|uniref:Nodulation protein N n=1 Tax=Rhizobium oryziradicis TaxID=1867956 RepID=A0A1Q8ZPQ5_9HYPH|nr:MaoC family dehydratase [Rhizobium oryziradicis]OLP44033.1 Nodulation protein N [Rhizobium oryziradicis]